MKNAASALILLAAMTHNIAGAPLQWSKMKEVYRILPDFFDDATRAKILKISPSDLIMFGSARNRKLVELFNEREREHRIPCGLHKWMLHAKKDIELLGTTAEKETLKRLGRVLKKFNHGKPMDCSDVRSHNHANEFNK